MYTSSRGQGLVAGVSLEGTVIGTRDKTNAEYYGKSGDASDILSAKVPPGWYKEVAAGFIEVLSSVNFFPEIARWRDGYLFKCPRPALTDPIASIPQESSALSAIPVPTMM